MQGSKWPLFYSHVDPGGHIELSGTGFVFGYNSPYKGDSARFS